MQIRQAAPADLKDALTVEREAFQSDVEPKIVTDILNDATAKPHLSLIAYLDDQAVGHILFSNAKIVGISVKASFLAPLAVKPAYQKRGVGGALVAKGLMLQAASGVELVFVVGHPQYYPRFGFKAALNLGFDPTFPMAEKDEPAWMVQELRPGVIGSVRGRVVCCDALGKPQYWRE